MNANRKNIVLIGGGGHFKSCMEVIHSTEKYNIVGILDMPENVGKEVMGYKIIGTEDDLMKLHQDGNEFLITVGQIKTATNRKRIYEKLKSIQASVATIIASSAYVSAGATIEEGTIIMHKTFVNAGVQIGANNIINTGAILEHDVKVGNHNHISTGALINGDCDIADENFIGSNCCIANGIKIGNGNILGAGSTVIRNIETVGVYVGNPAKRIR